MKKKYFFYLPLLLGASGVYAFDENAIPVNTPPTISMIANQSTCVNTSIDNLSFTIADAETPAADLLLSVISSDETLLSSGNIVFGGTDGNRTVTLTPVSGHTGSANITITVSDGVDSVPMTFAVQVVVDVDAPIAIAVDSIMIELDENGHATLTTDLIDNGSTDNCSIASMSLDKTAFTCDDLGLNLVTLTVTDGSGNSADAYTMVDVEDNLAPVAIVQDITVQLDETGSVTITPDQINNGSTDNCSIDSMSLDRTTFTCADVTDSGTPVVLTLMDASGSGVLATAYVTVQDNVAPAVATKDIVVQLDAEGNVSITSADIDNGSSDVCGIATMELDITSFTCEDIGDNVVTLTVTDIHNNVSSGVATVTVQDLIVPTVTTKNITVQLDENGEASIEVGDVVTASSDNCGISSSDLSQTDFTCVDAGDNIVTLTVIDTNGNVTNKDITVTVAGLPTITGDTGIGVGAAITLVSGVEGGIWTSSDETVATVDAETGVVTGVTAGTVEISYSVAVGACQLTASKEITVSSLGNNQFDLSKLSVYPNPVKDMLNIANNTEIKVVSVINLLGQELMTQTVNANLTQIDMSGLSNAPYMIKIKTDNAVKIIKVIKE